MSIISEYFIAGIPPLSHAPSFYPRSRSPSPSPLFYACFSGYRAIKLGQNSENCFKGGNTFISWFFNLTNDLSRPNQSPSTILKARPQVARNFLTLVLVSGLTVPCASLHTAVISYFLMNIFAESGRVELEHHRWDLSDHSPSETDASLDVLVKIFHQVRSWCEKAGLILIIPLFPLPIGYLRDTLEKLSLD